MPTTLQHSQLIFHHLTLPLMQKGHPLLLKPNKFPIEVLKEFLTFWEKEDTKLRRKIIRARKKLIDIKVSNEVLENSAKLCLALGSDGLRGELTLLRTSKAQASFENKDTVEISHLRKVASICLGHRLRKDPLDDVGSNIRVERTIEEVLGK